jgi:hypothetical protein
LFLFASLAAKLCLNRGMLLQRGQFSGRMAVWPSPWPSEQGRDRCWIPILFDLDATISGFID